MLRRVNALRESDSPRSSTTGVTNDLSVFCVDGYSGELPRELCPNALRIMEHGRCGTTRLGNNRTSQKTG